MILMIGIIGILGLMIKSININKQIPERIQASLLADEAMTVLRHIRDSNIEAGNAWDLTLSDCNSSNCFLGYNSGCFSWR